MRFEKIRSRRTTAHTAAPGPHVRRRGSEGLANSGLSPFYYIDFRHGCLTPESDTGFEARQGRQAEN